jgi:hypothetical protein
MSFRCIFLAFYINEAPEENRFQNVEAEDADAFRCPAMNLRHDWFDAILAILNEPLYSRNEHLVRT